MLFRSPGNSGIQTDRPKEPCWH
jgi:hypothetical protein